MGRVWQSEFQGRMHAFELRRPPRQAEVSVSLKVRVVSGCFHREHSPRAYALMDELLVSIAPAEADFTLVEHESGPEILVYLAVLAGGIGLAKSVIDLIVTILKARAEGIKKGDSPSHPLEIIVRRITERDKFIEETVLRVGHTDPINRAKIEAKLNDALKRLSGQREKRKDSALKQTRGKRHASKR